VNRPELAERLRLIKQLAAWQWEAPYLSAEDSWRLFRGIVEARRKALGVMSLAEVAQDVSREKVAHRAI